jgi:hypothetical protein
MQVQNWVAKAQNMATHRRRQAIYRKIMTHHRQAEIATEKRSPFRPHRGLAAPDIFLETMLDRRTWEACSIDCTEGLSNIYVNRSQTCQPNDKTYRYAQLGELVHTVTVEHALEHEVICGSKLTWEEHGEGETVAKRQPP